MVLLLHGVLLAFDTFEGLFYTFSMSQEAEAYREVFSLLMNATAQFIKCGCSAALAGRYGQRYVWDRRLGNVNYRSRTPSIELAAAYRDAIREAAALLCMGTSLVLLCACSDERTCHRSYVARLIQDALPVPIDAREVWA